MSDQNLYIQIENGIPISHPVIEENLKMFFPDLDPNNPPEGFCRFVKSPVPEPGTNEIIDSVSYELSNYYTDLYGVKTYVDIYHMKDISLYDKSEIVDRFKELSPQQADWVFDYATDSLVPPIPKPDDGEEYVWMYPNETVGENQGKWINVKEIKPVVASPEEFEALFEAMKELGMEINSNNMAEIPQSLIDELISGIRASTVPVAPEGPPESN